MEPRPGAAGGPDVRVGWHSVPGARGGKVEALVCPTHDPLAAAVLAEAHHSGVDLISIDIEALGDLRPAFDEIRPLEVGSVDHALTDALARLQRDGHVVAVLSAAAGQALASADVALGVMPRNGTDPPPWYADLVLPDLAAVWRVLHALPAAKTATRRGSDIHRRVRVGRVADASGSTRARTRPGDHRCGGGLLPDAGRPGRDC
ncbi:hypothetical protein H7I76_10510, partial [Mycolicibacterium vaccae]|nr:hypothetical protein [Mycolicibacterium vaccae]